MYELINLNTREELHNYKQCITYELEIMIKNTRNELKKYNSNLLLSLDITTRDEISKYCKKKMRDTDNQIMVYKNILIEIDRRIKLSQ
jgi:UDP-glucose 6-dehydrogenase